MLRFLHFSDVHLSAAPFGWKLRDTFSKRLVGYTNLTLLGRAKRFRRNERIVDAMIADAKRKNFDAMLFSGDATMLAFEREFEHAARRLGVNDPALPPAIAVPGNHDYYTRRAASAGYFETHFAAWQQGIRIGDSPYPFARKIGHAWIIGLNSSYHPFFNWNASGVVGKSQLERLKELCAKLDPGPRILVTHYPLRNAKGRIEIRSHRLLDQYAALTAAVECKISLWLHGHIHAPFVLQPTPGIPFPVICAGSCTQTHRMAHNEYELDGHTLRMQRRVFDLATGTFRDAKTFTFELS